MRHPYLSHPDLDPDWPIGFAHRGGHDVAPENTMASFEHAVSLGYRYLETDAHRTIDGALVSFHDPDLNRTCGIDAQIGEMTEAEVAEARVDGKHPIPLLSDLFEAFPQAHFNIDAKSDEAVEPLCDLVQAFDAVDRVCLASFEKARIDRMRTLLGGRLMTNMAPSQIGTLFAIGRLGGDAHRSAQVPPTAGRLPVVSPRFVKNAKRADVAVHVWTINDRVEMERLLDLGVDGVMTDETETLRDVFVEREVWPA
ncbi:MAG: glycerophosphodiester phosphodiesterase family protein [Ilumatobacter sp.]